MPFDPVEVQQAVIEIEELKARVGGFFETLDEALEQLTSGQEHKISALPRWALEKRDIKIGITPDNRGIAIRIMPNPGFDDDSVTARVLSSRQDLVDVLAPWEPSFAPTDLRNIPFFLIGETYGIEANNPLAAPVLDDPSITAYGDLAAALAHFTPENAKSEAISLWNNVLSGGGAERSFIRGANAVFGKFRAIIKRKAFLERKIHRFLEGHACLLLPAFRRFLYDHPLYLGDEVRKADFILEREAGTPPFLVELESPVHKVFRKNGELTAQANHAISQIAEWVAFIDKDAKRNAAGDFAFLAGPKLRLVVIGRGLEHRQRLLDTRFRDTTIWTYELLLDQAKSRWNDQIAEQYRVLELNPIRPF